jgi:hypothetical protein
VLREHSNHLILYFKKALSYFSRRPFVVKYCFYSFLVIFMYTVPATADTQGMLFSPIYEKNTIEIVYDNLSENSSSNFNERMLTRIKFDELLSYCNAQSIARLSTLFGCFYYGSSNAWDSLRKFSRVVEGSAIPLYSSQSFDVVEKIAASGEAKLPNNYKDILDILELGGFSAIDEKAESSNDGSSSSFHREDKYKPAHHLTPSKFTFRGITATSVDDSLSKSSVRILQEELYKTFLKLKKVERLQISLSGRLSNAAGEFSRKSEKINDFMKRSRQFLNLFTRQVPTYCGWVLNSEPMTKPHKGAVLTRHWVSVVDGIAYFLMQPYSGEVGTKGDRERFAD